MSKNALCEILIAAWIDTGQHTRTINTLRRHSMTAEQIVNCILCPPRGAE